jgi:hypothetical protein
MTTKQEIWQGWTGRYVDTASPVPIFKTDKTLTIQYKHYGKDDRRILKRSEEMESLVREAGSRLSKKRRRELMR